MGVYFLFRAIPLILAGISVAAVPADAEWESLVARYQEAFNSRDAVALAAFFTPDADMVMGNLPEARGREAIELSWAAYFGKQEAGRKGWFEVRSARLLAPGVGLVNVDTTTVGSLPTRRARGTWVVVRHDGEWLIASLRGLPSLQDRVVLNAVMDRPEPNAAPDGSQPEIRAFAQSYEQAFNRRDPSALTALYSREADIIVRDEPVRRGREAIEAWWRDYFEDRPYFSDPELRIRFSIREVRTFGPEVAVVNLIAGQAGDPGAPPRPMRKARATWIVVHQEGDWRLAALRVLPGLHDEIIRGGALAGGSAEAGRPRIPYVRVFADATGASHFVDESLELEAVEEGAASGLASVSQAFSLSQAHFFCFQPGAVVDWHPAPRRQFYWIVSGELELEASDGEIRRFRPGSLILGEATRGIGVRARWAGEQPCVAVAALAEDSGGVEPSADGAEAALGSLKNFRPRATR